MTEAIAPQSAARSPQLRVAVFATMPENAYSGGRYYALMLAEALSEGGHEVHLITNQVPIFFKDMEPNPGHRNITVTLTRDFRTGLPEGVFDIAILVPAAALAGFYHRVEIFAIEHGAHLVFVNFESGDWFNSLSPVPRNLNDWDPWKRAARYASVVLSISQEGNRWAQGFYRRSWPKTRFEFCYPPVNTRAADSVSIAERERRVLLFMRFSTSRHKGSESIDQLFCEALRGHTLAFILGKEDVPTPIYEKLVALSAQFGTKLEFLPRLSDVQKFHEIKRSRLVLFPSMFEGYGYPPVEALYCGTPCVAFRLPVLEESCGDKLFYAQHGNWDDFRKQIERALTIPACEDDLRAQVTAIAPIRVATEQLELIFGRLTTDRSSLTQARKHRLSALKFQERWKLSDPGLRWRSMRTRIKKRVMGFAARAVQHLRARRRKRHRVTYFPRFESGDELTNQWYRANWYLPFVSGRNEEVVFATRSGVRAGARPGHMCDARVSTDHFRLLTNKLAWLSHLLFSDLILVWKKDSHSMALNLIAKLSNIPVVSVATDDLQAREYGAYCSLLWKHLTPALARDLKLFEHQRRFHAVASRLREQQFHRACVFGTGPSLESATRFDYGKALKIVCNSIVQNTDLMDYLKPQFVCAGDVVSHLGVSAYAGQFRQDLLTVLRRHDTYFVTTAEFGSLLLCHYPEIEDKVFLLAQTTEEPNFNLLYHYGAPKLDSTLNIHMLPLAATFSDEICLLGCDGKSTDRSNEDFWAHAQKAQYFDLVDTGHRCHPTFDVHRQQSTYDRFIHSTRRTVEKGEAQFGKRYTALMPSNIPVLRDRTLHLDPSRLTDPSTPLRLDDVLARKNNTRTPPGANTVSPALPLVMGISKSTLDAGLILQVAGWALARPRVDRIEVWFGDRLMGSANLGVKRSDVLNKHPQYAQEDGGFQFVGKLDSAPSPAITVQLKVYAADDLLRDERVNVKRS